MEETVKRPPLEDMMVAMDVVDTLRHREKLVTKELDSEGRRERLIARLRKIYAAQGIKVTDTVLEEGVRALEEDRFSYSPANKSFSTLFAKLYVKRASWGKPFFILLAACLIGWSVYYFTMVRPETVRQNQLPTQIEKSYKAVATLSKDQVAIQRAQALRKTAMVAVDNGNYDEATVIQNQLQSLLSQLKSSYRLRVVSRPNKRSGVWRIPDVNTNARNYYLVVEAVDKSGKVLTMPITSEESGKTRDVSSWGLRVDKRTFDTVAADKQDDGIIQRNVVGEKKRGVLQPSYNIATKGDAITEW